MARRFLSAIKLLTGSTPPAGTAGDTFFDTDTKTIQVHDGDAWVNSTVRATDGAAGGRVFTGDTTPSSPVTGDLWVDSTGFSAGANIIRWRKTAVGAETSLSGLDDLSTTLSYTPGYEQVYINGALQVRSQDYVATTGTTLTGLAALVVGDVVEVISPSNMVYGDYYTQSQADTRYYTKTQSNAIFPNMTTMPSNRNVIINGGMEIDQRNNSAVQTITAGAALAYTVDRWYVFCTGANVTSDRIDQAPGSPVYRLEITAPSAGVGTVTGIGVGQRIESNNSYHLAGKTVTLSAVLDAATTVTYSVYRANSTDTFGTLASPTRTLITTGTFSAGYGTVRSATFAMPSNATTGIEIVFTTGTYPATEYLGIWNVQLELGSVATAFEKRPIGTELALCQRYYQNIVTPNATTDFNGLMVREGTTQAQASVYLPVSMRSLPTLVGSNFGRSVFRDTAFNVSGIANSGISISSSGPSNNWITLVITHGAIAGTFVFAEWDLLNTTTNLGLSAEL